MACITGEVWEEVIVGGSDCLQEGEVELTEDDGDFGHEMTEEGPLNTPFTNLRSDRFGVRRNPIFYCYTGALEQQEDPLDD